MCRHPGAALSTSGACSGRFRCRTHTQSDPDASQNTSAKSKISNQKSRLAMIFHESRPSPPFHPRPRSLIWQAGAGVVDSATVRQRLVGCVRDRAAPNIDVLPAPVMPRPRGSRPSSTRGLPVAPSPGSRGDHLKCRIYLQKVFLKKDAPIY